MRSSKRSVTVRYAGIVAMIAVAAIVFAAVELAVHWPFSRSALARSLGVALHSTVSFQNFRETYFPPGCIAQGVTVTPQHAAGSAAAFKEVRIESSYSGLLAHRIRRILLDRGDVTLSALGPIGSLRPSGNQSNVSVDEILTNASALQLGDEKFVFHRLKLVELSGGRLGINVVATIPKPSGQVTLQGTIGPWRSDAFDQVQLSGSFTLEKANLDTFQNVAGTISSQGTFDGVLSHINVSGSTDIPDFESNHNGHRHHLKVNFRAVVNGMNGATTLSSLNAELDHTAIIGKGAVVQERPNQGFTIQLDVTSGRGRVEDLLLLFVKAPRAPMVGAISFTTRITVPPDHRKFTQKVRLNGNFDIGSAVFTNPTTRAGADSLSIHAEGEPKQPPAPVRERLQGQVSLSNGTANFSKLVFGVPGANADLSGTFNVSNHRADLHGRMAMQAELSQTMTGFKSVLLKFLNPFFKRKHAGAVVPVSITGTYEHPVFQALTAKKK